MVLRFLVESLGLIMLVTIKRKKKKMKRQKGKIERHEEFVVLSKGANVIVELDASFPMMNK